MKQLKISILMLLIFTLFTGVIYPALITGIGKVFFNDKINGSLIVRNGSVTGSSLIGQTFVKQEFFQGRPSSVSYDAAGSGGNNFGPTNKTYIENVKNRVALIRKDFNLSDNKTLPSDFVFASGSGLDPHISMESAMLQADRIASARKIDKSAIEDIIRSNCERQMYSYGIPFVNVLKLNLALIDKGNQR